MITSSLVMPERTSDILGAGLGRHNLLVQGEAEWTQSQIQIYSDWGMISEFLDDNLINAISSNVGAVVNTIAMLCQNDKISDKHDAIGYISGEGTKMVLSEIKQFANRLDKTKPIEGIIKMMRYCKNDSDSTIIDSSVQEIISILPMPNQKLKKIYISKPVDSIYEYSKLNYSKQQRETIGFILYYMLRAAGYNVDNNPRLSECLNVLEVSKYKKEYSDKYFEAALNRGNQVYLERIVLEQFAEPTKLKGINPRYISKVLNKASYYMPQGYENQSKVMEFASRGIDAILDKDEEAGINVCGEALCFILDSKKSNEKSDMLEECRSTLVKEHGMAGNDVDKKIIPASQDVRNGYED